MTTLTCADVESHDVEARYLAGTLPAAEAAAYEAHYFGCDTCWPSLQRATELRAAFAVPEPRPGPLREQRPARRVRAWGLAAAAGLVVVVGMGVFLRDSAGDTAGGTAGDTESRSTLRGTGDEFTLRAVTGADSTSIAWGAVPDAGSYLVRLYQASGDLVVERETADTTFALGAASVAPRTSEDTLYWQVLALDRLRQTLARSPLTAAPPPASP